MTRALALAVALALALAGCGDGDRSIAPDMTAAAPDMACATTCPVCTGGRVCVIRIGGPAPFPAACMRPCQEARECGRTVTCVTIEGASPAGSYCVGDAEPGRCGEGCATLPTGASSCDGDILVSPYALDVCGFERVRCANGCGVLGLDGGSGAACL